MEIHDRFAAILRGNAGEGRLLVLLVHDLDLVHDLGRHVLQGGRRVVKEEGLAADGDLIHLLPVDLNLAILAHFHARHLLDQVLQHGIVAHVEGRRVVDQRVLLDLDGITDRRNRCCINDFRVFFQFDYAQFLLVIPEIIVLGKGVVADQLHVQPVATHGHVRDLHLPFHVGQGKMGDGRVALRVQVHRGEGQRLLGLGVLHGQFDLDVPVVHEHIVVHHDHLRIRSDGQQQAGNNSK